MSEETRCRHIGYSYRLTARVLLYAPSHRQDSTYHGLFTLVVQHWLEREIAQWVHPMKDRSDDPSHHQRTLYLWATSRSQEPAKAGTCACYRRALQQLALNVHVKHSDLTWPVLYPNRELSKQTEFTSSGLFYHWPCNV